MEATISQGMDVLFQPHIDRFVSKIAASIQAMGKNIVVDDVDAVAKSIGDMYASEILAITIRVQLALKEERSEGDGDGLGYPEWAATDEARSMVRARYPELMRILEVKQRHLVSLIDNVLHRFVEDRTDLASKGFPTGERVIAIAASAGDSHRGGQRVCFLETDAGHLVYKPRPMLIDLAVSQAASIVNAKLPVEMAVTVPVTLDRSGYGWQEFIEQVPARDEVELAAYYRSLGALSAFFAALGGHDMHYENITVVRGKAVPLDLEVALGTLSHAQRLNELTGVEGLLDRAAMSAGAGTLILPPLIRSERFDIDLSPVTDGSPQKSQTMLSFRVGASGNGDTDAEMTGAIVDKPIPYVKSLDSAEVHPRKFVVDFSQGHNKMTQVVGTCSSDLKRLFMGLPHIPNRCIIRPTSTYGAFLDASYHPEYLVSRQERHELFTRLGRPPGAPLGIGEQAAKAECETLLDGEFPYFTDDQLASFLAETGEAVIDNEASPVEDFRVAPVESLEGFGSVPSDIVRYIQHGAFAAIDPEVWNTRDLEEITPFFRLNLETSWVQAVHDLARQAQTLVLKDDGGTAAMFMQSVGADRRIRTAPLDASYYEGQGVLHLFNELAQKSGNPEDAAMLAALLRDHIDSRNFVLSEPVSGFIGVFSRMRLLPIVRYYLGPETADRLEADLISFAKQSIEISGTQQTDYVTGLAGALTILGADGYCTTEGSRALRDQMHKAVGSALEDSQLNSITGVAHGPIGYMLGLVAGGGHLSHRENQNLRNRTREQARMEFEDANAQSPSARQAWCSGIPGVAEAFVQVLDATGGIDPVDEDLIAKLFAQFRLDQASLQGPTDLSICHGAAGALSAWSRIAMRLPTLRITDDIEHDATRLRERLAAGELEVRGGVRHATSSLGMMLGMSGAVLALSRIEVTDPPQASFLSRKEDEIQTTA